MWPFELNVAAIRGDPVVRVHNRPSLIVATLSASLTTLTSICESEIVVSAVGLT
jgi:hypothetical protein